MGFSIYHAGDWKASDFDTGSGQIAKSIANFPDAVLSGMQMKKENERKDKELSLQEQKEARAEQQRLDDKSATDAKLGIMGQELEQGNKRLDIYDEQLRQQGLLTTAQIKKIEQEVREGRASEQLLYQKLKGMDSQLAASELTSEIKRQDSDLKAYIMNHAEETAVPNSAFHNKIIALKKQYGTDPNTFHALYKDLYQFNVTHNPKEIAVNAATHDYEKQKRIINGLASTIYSLKHGKYADKSIYPYNGDWLVKQGQEMIKEMKKAKVQKTETAHEKATQERFQPKPKEFVRENVLGLLGDAITDFLNK